MTNNSIGEKILTLLLANIALIGIYALCWYAESGRHSLCNVPFTVTDYTTEVVRSGGRVRSRHLIGIILGSVNISSRRIENVFIYFDNYASGVNHKNFPRGIEYEEYINKISEKYPRGKNFTICVSPKLATPSDPQSESEKLLEPLSGSDTPFDPESKDYDKRGIWTRYEFMDSRDTLSMLYLALIILCNLCLLYSNYYGSNVKRNKYKKE